MNEYCEKSRDVEAYCIENGTYPYEILVVEMPSGVCMVADCCFENVGDILYGNDGELYFALGKPYWRGRGVPDDLDAAYHLPRCLANDAFLGMEIKFDSRTGKVTLGRMVFDSARRLISGFSGYNSDNLKSVCVPFRDANSGIDWQVLMEEVKSKLACSIPLNVNDSNMLDTKVFEARLHRFRVMLLKVALINWDADVASVRRGCSDWERADMRHSRAKVFLEAPGSGNVGDICALLKEYGVSDEMLKDGGGEPAQFERPDWAGGDLVAGRIAGVKNAVEQVRRGGHSIVEMPRFKRDRFERVGDNLILDQIGGETKSIFEMRTIMVTDLARGLATDLWSDRFIRLDREKISIILNSVSNVLVWVGQGFSFNDSELRIVTAVCRLISYERSDDSSKVLEFVYARLHAHSYAEKRFG